MRKQTKWSLPSQAIELIAARFKLLAEPVRIQILQTLHDGPMNVTDITRAIGSTQPNVSKHLRLLQDGRIIARRQEGNTVYYSIADQSVFELCDAVCGSLKKGFAQGQAIFR
jgi:ArsR family transcriptional regulator